MRPESFLFNLFPIDGGLWINRRYTLINADMMAFSVQKRLLFNIL